MSLKFFIFGLSTDAKMDKDLFIKRYSELGRRLVRWLDGVEKWPELDEAVEKEAQDNLLFTPYMQRRALEAIAVGFLNEDGLGRWVEKYPRAGKSPGVCGVVAAGNIPAVAFQDILSVLAAGWRPVVKLSSKDRYLLPVLFPDVEFCGSVSGWHADALITMGGDAAAEYFRKNFPEVPKLIRADALITMGGDAAAEYFRKNFPEVPKLIRASRFSLAVLEGGESGAALEALAEDMLLYYGLGCRSVTWLLVPEGYEMRPLMTAAEDFAVRCLGRPAADNHRRNKAVLTLAGETFLDSGTVIFRHLDGDSPYGQSLQVGEVWYSEYRRHADVDKFIRANEAMLRGPLWMTGPTESMLWVFWADWKIKSYDSIQV